MGTGEAGGATDLVAAEADPRLQEPEAILRIAAVVEAVQAEVDDVAGRERPRRACGPIAAAGRVVDWVRRQGVACCEGVQNVVLVGQAARPVLPGPVRDELRILGAASDEDRGVERAIARPRPYRRTGGVGGRAATPRGERIGVFVTDLVPVVRRRWPDQLCRRRGVAVELECAGVVHRLRARRYKQRDERDQKDWREQEPASPPARPRAEDACGHPQNSLRSLKSVVETRPRSGGVVMNFSPPPFVEPCFSTGRPKSSTRDGRTLWTSLKGGISTVSYS